MQDRILMPKQSAAILQFCPSVLTSCYRQKPDKVLKYPVNVLIGNRFPFLCLLVRQMAQQRVFVYKKKDFILNIFLCYSSNHCFKCTALFESTIQTYTKYTMEC